MDPDFFGFGSGSGFCPDPNSGKKSDPDPDRRTRIRNTGLKEKEREKAISLVESFLSSSLNLWLIAGNNCFLDWPIKYPLAGIFNLHGRMAGLHKSFIEPL